LTKPHRTKFVSPLWLCVLQIVMSLAVVGGDAAAAVLDGLVALSLDAEEAQQQIDQGTSPAMREALRIDAAHRAEVAHQAEIIQGEVLEQATKMGQAVVNSVAMPPAIR
jgi:hypothetical protein